MQQLPATNKQNESTAGADASVKAQIHESS